jgi:hypothetical protein
MVRARGRRPVRTRRWTWLGSRAQAYTVQPRQALHEVLVVPGVTEDGAPLQAPRHHVVQHAGACPPVLWRGVEAGTAGHGTTVAEGGGAVKTKL